METERHEKETTKSDADREKSDAVTDLEVALDIALRAGISNREICKIIEEVLEYSL